MPIKQLPAIGDSNWGTTLNNYIAQTTDNNNGGAFNQFDDVNNRPNNLNIDDKGKSYLNIRSGNFHEWSGTEWKILSKGVSNVYDFKDSGTDNTAMFEAAIAYARANNMSEVVVPAGIFSLNLTITGSPITIRGLSNLSSITPTVSTEDYAITYRDITGEGMRLIDLQFGGGFIRPAGNLGNGIRHIETTSKYGIEFNNLRIDTFKIGVFKSGSQRSKFYGCKFAFVEVGVLAINNGSQPSGFDYFENTFLGTIKAAIFYKNDQTIDGVNLVLNHCWFESNKGITIYAKGMGVGNKSFVVEQTWFEANVQQSGTPVTIQGITYNPTELILDNSQAIFLQGQPLNGIRMSNNSYLKTECIAVSQPEIDDSSFLDVRETGGEGSSGDYVAEFGSFFTNFAQGINTIRTVNNRPTLTKGYKNLYSDGALDALPANTNVFGNQGVVIAEIVSGDSLYENKCLKLTFSALNDTWGFVGSSQITKKYVVGTYSVKSLNNFETKLSIATLKDNNWRTFVFIGKTSTFGGTLPLDSYFQIKNLNAQPNSSILLSKIQTVEFDTYQEAANYFRSDLYALPSKSAVISHGDAIPNNGTAARGDIVYNTNPTVGSYTGWICTAAGAPGTWNPFGLISA